MQTNTLLYKKFRVQLTMAYKELLAESIKQAHKLGFVSHLKLDQLVTAKDAEHYKKYADRELLQVLIQHFGKGYWSNSCIQLAAQTFLYFQYMGISCELVYGEVVINGCHEYDATIDGLISEWESGYSATPMDVHVWVNIGKDFIVDPAIASRLSEYYDPNLCAHQVIVGRANFLRKKMRLEYIPMLSGTKFLEKTCNISL